MRKEPWAPSREHICLFVHSTYINIEYLFVQAFFWMLCTNTHTWRVRKREIEKEKLKFYIVSEFKLNNKYFQSL